MSRDVDENAKITVNAKTLHDVLRTFNGSASRAFDSLVREFNAWLQSGETVEPEPLTITVTGPRSCRDCGWTLPEQFTGYYGACPVCLLIASGQEDLVVTEAVLRRYCEKNGCVIYPAPRDSHTPPERNPTEPPRHPSMDGHSPEATAAWLQNYLDHGLERIELSSESVARIVEMLRDRQR